MTTAFPAIHLASTQLEMGRHRSVVPTENPRMYRFHERFVARVGKTRGAPNAIPSLAYDMAATVVERAPGAGPYRWA